jgi:aminomethyltransferase
LSPTIEHPEILLYTRIRKSPFFNASRRHGVAMYSVYNHTYHPRHYGDPVEEYWQLLNGVTLWDVGVERQVEIIGPDAFTFTNMLVARDLAKCEVGQCKYVFVTAPDGGIINDPVLLRLGENHFWLSLADSDVLLWAQGVAHNSGMDVTIREPDVGPVQIQGPKSKDVMVDLFGDDVLDLPYYFLRRYQLQGMEVLVSRTGYTAELGYEIYLFDATQHGEQLWDAVLEAGGSHGLTPLGLEALDMLRIEAGLIFAGYEFDDQVDPFEAGIGFTVKLDSEDDFVGKEALIERSAHPQRKLVGLELEGNEIAGHGDEVYVGRQRVGVVTSGTRSPTLRKNIALCRMSVQYAEDGTGVEVGKLDGLQKRIPAQVVPFPFYDPKKERPRS